jgi:hypothetical protein
LDDIVAIAVELTNGEVRYSLTWGRIFDTTDGSRLEELAIRGTSQVDLGGTALRARLHDSLQNASRERYFYESMFAMAQQRIPFEPSYAEWAAGMRSRVESGKEWYYPGVPLPPPEV